MSTIRFMNYLRPQLKLSLIFKIFFVTNSCCYYLFQCIITRFLCIFISLNAKQRLLGKLVIIHNCHFHLFAYISLIVFSSQTKNNAY